MKVKYFQLVLSGLTVISLSLALIAAPVGHAQSSQTWSDPINLSNAGSSTSPGLIVDASGTIHALWIDQFEGYKYTKSTDGVNWTAPKAVRFPFAPVNTTPPVFFPDQQGVIHALWQNQETRALYYSRVTSDLDVPSYWMVGEKLADLVLSFDAVMGPQGILHLAYYVGAPDEETNSNPNKKDEIIPTGVYYRHLTGFNWSLPQNLYSSQYFRALKPEDTNVRLTLSEKNNPETVYVAWDDRPQKRILLSKSVDGGENWSESREVVVPELTSGLNVPFNVEITTLKEGLLMMWQVGDPGVRCTQYSKWSIDGGDNWNEPIKMFDEFAVCPEKTEFISIDPNYAVAFLSSQADLSLIAWNGAEWSEPEIQSGLSTISNPRTFETILFGCQQISSKNGILFVVGCDQGSGGDVWFISRKLDPLENLFPSPSAWSSPRDVATSLNKLSSVTSVSNTDGSVFVLWTETSNLDPDRVEPKIQYVHESGGEWSKPASVITDLKGLPAELSVTIDNQQRLLLVWVDQNTGDLLFSWANSHRANIPSEWAKPINLPSPSRLNDSPDILVDASGRVVVATAVTVNEDRGIYLTQSTDLGKTWSAPVTVIDAALAGWDGIDRPAIALTGDGHLHLLYHRISVLGLHEANGLYYSRSIDGGVTWSKAEPVSEQKIRWSEIVGFDEQVLHRLWQQEEKSTVVTYHQVTRDGGETWESPQKISILPATVPAPTLSIDWTGKLHLVQLVNEDNQVFQEWEWIETHWRSLETRKWNIESSNTPVSIHAGVTSKGIFYALLLFEHSDLKVKLESRLVNTSRSLNLSDSPQMPVLASIVEPVAISVPDVNSNLQQNPTPISPLAGMAEPSFVGIKNVIGAVLVLSVALMILVFILPRRKKPLR
jgi:hypothetical protein